MEPAEVIVRLSQIPIGGRLMVRSRVDWRTAVVAKHGEEKTTLAVTSAKGRCYRLFRAADAEVLIEGNVAVLSSDAADRWRENFLKLDSRW